MKKIEKIKTRKDVISQLRKWRDEIGLGFHPDTPGKDYVTQDGTLLFTADEASEYDAKIQRCFETSERLGLDFYELALNYFLPVLRATSEF